MRTIALTEPELRFLAELAELGVRYLIVGVGAAALQGADAVTADIDLWFEDQTDPRIAEAARRVGGVYVSGQFGMMPPMIGGDVLGDRLDVVTHAQGLERFPIEYEGGVVLELDGLDVRVLPLRRIIASKRAAGRAKDLAVLPALEAALAASSDESE